MLKKVLFNKTNFITLSLFISHSVVAQDNSNNLLNDKSKLDSLSKNERLSYHFQTTMVDMDHSKFYAPYSGNNSLRTNESQALSVTSTLFLGLRLWKGGEVYFNPELSGGKGLSSTTGIAGFPNGEVYRVGDPTPVITVARIFLRQTIDLGGNRINLDAGQNQLCRTTSESKLVFTLGKFSTTDVFDANSYSHDPRNQFLNWGMMTGGAWDYAANTRGYTYGFVAELIQPGWSVKGAIVMEPEVANGPYMDMNIAEAHSENVEFDKIFTIRKRNGAIRIIGYYNQAHMGNYRQAIAENPTPDVAQTRSYTNDKWGFIVNAEQQINENVGVFGRYSWNNGTSETWAFTEIDRSLNLGIQLRGSAWKRPNDNLGIAWLVNGLSKDHRDYLAAGGNGFIIGDGQLNYGMEHVAELYYSAKLFSNFWLSPDYQFVLNPAYNKDRGPIVHIFGIRGHIEF